MKIITLVGTEPGGYQIMTIRANSEGLLTLAKFLLILAQPSMIRGKYFHFDDLSLLEKGSAELVIDKL